MAGGLLSRVRDARASGSPRFVEHGRVWCPRAQADVDVDRCLVCPRLASLDRGDPARDRFATLRCREPAARRFDAWM